MPERAKKSAFDKRLAAAAARGGLEPPPTPGSVDVTILSSRRESDALIALSCRVMAVYAGAVGAAPAAAPCAAGQTLSLLLPSTSATKLRLEAGRLLRVHAPLCAVRLSCGSVVILVSWRVQFPVRLSIRDGALTLGLQ